MKKVLITASLALFFIGASHFADACSGTYVSTDVVGAMQDFAANCSPGDSMDIIDFETGVVFSVSIPEE
jgi:hypothetical protein